MTFDPQDFQLLVSFIFTVSLMETPSPFSVEDLGWLLEKYGGLNTRAKRTMDRVRFGQENIAEFRTPPYFGYCFVNSLHEVGGPCFA